MMERYLIRLTIETVERVDRLAARLKVTKAVVIRGCVDNGLDWIEQAETNEQAYRRLTGEEKP